MYKLNGRNVVDIEIDGIDPNDAPDFCDAHISNAIYEDTGESLNEAELEQLDADDELIYNLIQDELQGMLDYTMDMIQDR